MSLSINVAEDKKENEEKIGGGLGLKKAQRDFSLRRATRRRSDGKEELGLLRSK
jgi:hypothetical protein